MQRNILFQDCQCSSQLHLQIWFVSMQRNILFKDCLVLFIASSTNLFCEHAKKYPVSRLSSALHNLQIVFLCKEISCFKIVLCSSQLHQQICFLIMERNILFKDGLVILHLQICFVSMQRNILFQGCLVLFIDSSTNLVCEHAKKYPV